MLPDVCNWDSTYTIPTSCTLTHLNILCGYLSLFFFLLLFLWQVSRCRWWWWRWFVRSGMCMLVRHVFRRKSNGSNTLSGDLISLLPSSATWLVPSPDPPPFSPPLYHSAPPAAGGHNINLSLFHVFLSSFLSFL